MDDNNRSFVKMNSTNYDWETSLLCDIVDKIRPISYGIVQTGPSIVNGIKCIRVTDITDGRIDPNNLITTSEKINNSYRRTSLRAYDLVIALRGKIGEVAIIDESLVGANLTRGVALIAPKENFDSHFIYHLLRSELVVELLKKSLNGSALQELSIGVLRKIPIRFPKRINEQKAIAAVLSTVDISLSKTRELIAQKELRKKGLMQQLLTGKKRLKGFSDVWSSVRVGEKFCFLKSFSIPRDGLTGHRIGTGINCIHYGDIHALFENHHLNFATQEGIPNIADLNFTCTEQDLLRVGDIILADASEDYKGVGEAVEVLGLGDKKAVGGLHTIVLRDVSQSTANLFRGYLFSSEPVRNEMRRLSTGTSVYSISKSTLESMILNIPPIDEQIAIAKVLRAVDLGIQLLKAKAERLREQKKGLMQVLLTGKKRLKEFRK